MPRKKACPEKTMSGPNEKPGYSALRRFRHSAAGAEYFITTNLQVRGTGLEEAGLRDQIKGQWMKLQNEGIWQVRTAVIMPDHVHLLVELGLEAELAGCMRLFKGPLTPLLRSRRLVWQDGYYEHRMRVGDDCLPVFLYILLNPYRAGLAPLNEEWPGYHCAADDWAWFGSLTEKTMPQPEWLR